LEDIQKRRLEKQLIELNMFVTLEKIEEALYLAKKILVRNPDCGEVYYLKGILYFTQSNWLQSLHEFQKAVELDNIHPAKRASSLIYSCYAFCSLKMFEEALSVADEAISINPRLEAAYRGKAEAYEGLGKYREALEYYNKAIQTAPSNLINLERKVEILRKLDENEEALKVTEKLVQLEPFNPSPYVKQIQLLRQLRRYEEALRLIDISVDLFPENHQIYYQKALVLYDQGQIPQALGYLERADFLHPGDRLIRSLMTTLTQ